jgi:Ca2+-binding RTX toxin-like protein
LLTAVEAVSSDSGRVATSGNDNDTGQDTITGFKFGTDTITVTATAITDFVHGTNTAIGTATGAVDTGVAGSFLATTGLIDIDSTATLTIGTGDLAVTFATPSVTMTETLFEAALRYNMTGAGTADTITGGALDDILVGGDGVDTLTGGAGNDYLQGSVSGDSTDADVMIGGAGNDTYAFITAVDEADTLITELSGTDTIYVGGSISLATLEIGATNTSSSAATDFIGATAALQIEQLVILSGATATVLSTQVDGNALNVTETGADTTNLTVTVITANDVDLSNLTFTATTYMDASGVDTATTAFTSGTDVIAINGATGANTIIGSSLVDTIDGGGAADVIDTITGGKGGDIITLSASTAVHLVNVAAGDTELTIGGSADAGTITGFDTLNVDDAFAGDGTNLSSNLNVAGTGALITAAAVNDGTTSTLNGPGSEVIGSITVAADGEITFDDATTFNSAVTLADDNDLAAAVQFLQANDLGGVGSTGWFTSKSVQYVYTQGSADGADNTLDTLVKIAGDTVTAMSTANANTAADLFFS